MHIDPAPLIALQLQALRIARRTDGTMPNYITRREQWDSIRPRVTQLHADGCTLEEIMAEVEEVEHLKATQAMFKNRLREWGLKKYNRREEVQLIMRIRRDRAREGQDCIFHLRGVEVDMDDLERYVKRHRVPIDESPVTTIELDNMPDLAVSTPPRSPSSDPEEAVLTPSSVSNMSSPPLSSSPALSTSSTSLSPSWSPSFPPLHMSIAPPTTLGHCEEYINDTSIVFEIAIKSRFWTLSESPEMPWSPGNATSELSQPKIEAYYWQDECYRHLDNGVVLLKSGDWETAYKEWNEAFWLVQEVVQAKHYNTLGKLLACINLLDRENYPIVADRFRAYVGEWAARLLGPNHLYTKLFGKLKHLEANDIEELQLVTLRILVKGLEQNLGGDAFTTFEHQMVLSEKTLSMNPSQEIDTLLPTIRRCEELGFTSSKKMLALHMRNGILQHRNMLIDAYQTCLDIQETASAVEDPGQRLWHMVGAYMTLARLQQTAGLFAEMRMSLQSAWDTEEKLRQEHGLIKLGDGEVNWILTTLKMDPIFRADGPDEIGLEGLSLE